MHCSNISLAPFALPVLIVSLVGACTITDDPFVIPETTGEETTGEETTTTPSETTTGDGDGDPTTTGDGDGDWTTTGDGDGDLTGDGDGDPATGDGDGDPVPDFPSPDTWYRLQTAAHGGSHCLESNQADWDWHMGNSFMDNCGYYSGQIWRFDPVTLDGKTWYRLHSDFQGDDKCLDGNDPESMLHDGAAFMADCSASQTQLWELAAYEGWYLLKNKEQGPDYCLEGNGLGENSVKGGTAFMGACEPFTGQLFHIGSAELYEPELCEPLGLPVSVQDLDGGFCSYECEVDEDCPTGPEGTDNLCGLVSGETSYCGLWCNPQDDTCPGDSICQAFPNDPNLGLCTFG